MFYLKKKTNIQSVAQSEIVPFCKFLSFWSKLRRYKCSVRSLQCLKRFIIGVKSKWV